MSQSVSEKPEKVILHLEVPAILVRRATREEWKNRDPEDSLLPVGSLALLVDLVDVELGEGGLPDTGVQSLLESGQASVFAIEGHATSDGRPLCRKIGDPDAIIGDLAIVPVFLSELPITATH